MTAPFTSPQTANNSITPSSTRDAHTMAASSAATSVPPFDPVSRVRSATAPSQGQYANTSVTAMRYDAAHAKSAGFGISKSLANFKSRFSRNNTPRLPKFHSKSSTSPDTSFQLLLPFGSPPQSPGLEPDSAPSDEHDTGKKRKRIIVIPEESADESQVSQPNKAQDAAPAVSPDDMASLTGMLWAMPSHYSPGTTELTQSPLATASPPSSAPTPSSPLRTSALSAHDLQEIPFERSKASAHSSTSPAMTSPSSPSVKAVSPLNGKLRDPLDFDKPKSPSRGHAPSASTAFYSSASDSEAEDEGNYTSNNSLRSSRTSYGTNTSGNGDNARPQAKPLDGSVSPEMEQVLKPFRYPRSQSSSRSSLSHSSNTSIASVGSTATAGSRAPVSRVHSFSRPLRNSPLQVSLANNSLDKVSYSSSSLQSHIGAQSIDKASTTSLDAIREDGVRSGDQPPKVVMTSAEIVPQTRQTGPQSAPRHVEPLAISRSVPSPVVKAPSPEEMKLRSQMPLPRTPKIPLADRQSARPLSLAITRQSEAMITADAAETVILRILECLESLTELFAAARINRGFYRVFKKYEIWLMKNAIWNMSPAAWELREASPKEIIAALEKSNSEYTPTRYLQFYTRDSYVLAALKSVILDRCQSYLRPETISALRERDSVRLAELDDALWRIWTFCTMFGCDKGREDDLVAQMDWLRGGMLARSLPAPSTISGGRSQSIATTANASHPKTSEWFGAGNFGGLTVDELYDMTEMWNCIKALLHGIAGPGRVVQARAHGIFDHVDIKVGDKLAEEATLEEWTYYVTTLGLSAVVDLAPQSNLRTESVFITAADMEWNKWTPPRDGASRANFLKEAVSRVYDEKMAEQGDSPTTQEVKAVAKAKRRSRGQELAAELREKKRSVDFKTVPVSDDRPMSLWLEWQRFGDGPKLQDMPPLPTAEPSSVPQSGPQPKPSHSRANTGTLSLFPPQYVRSPNSSAAPSATNSATSSPHLSRVEPLCLNAVSVPTLKQPEPPGSKQRKTLSAYVPKLDVCHEATV